MANNARGIHVSPGIYSKETELTYAVKTLGVTTLGLAGETVKGPAFEPVSIENWREFQEIFGGTNPEKFKDSRYPKYELPYIAKSYLSESNQLEVCRVLGLSGYNAGPAWVIKTVGNSDEYDGVPVALLRSRGHYEKYYKYTSMNENGASCDCNGGIEYDVLIYEVGEAAHTDCSQPTTYDMDAISLKPYDEFDTTGNLCDGYVFDNESGATPSYFESTVANYGKFRIDGKDSYGESFSYAVSLNPSDKDYIIKVLGTNPHDGDAPLFVESLYDVALKQMIEEGDIKGINVELEKYAPSHVGEYCSLNPVSDFLNIPELSLTRKQLGKRYVCDTANATTCHKFDYQHNAFIDGNAASSALSTTSLGQIYTVKQFTDNTGKRHYYYAYVDEDTIPSSVTYGTSSYLKIVDKLTECTGPVKSLPNSVIVKVSSDGRYWKMVGNELYPISLDLNNYKGSYRFASTPWVVSNVKGDANNIELTRLFRFHTISDGNTANQEVKISIVNIDYENNQFDVYVRDINDVDASPVILEKYTKCTLTPTDKNYIAYKIGSYDGVYELQSKYVSVEVNETLATQNSVPCGFLGYPLTMFNGNEIAYVDNHKDMKNAIIKYNVDYDDEKKVRKQYFGLSDIIGVDLDMFTYKGETAYYDDPSYLSQGFHLDSRLCAEGYTEPEGMPTITVDGVTGFNFDAVSVNARTDTYSETPVIGTDVEMDGSIYSNIATRKFTMYLYGGFDGWDEYREARTNTDEFTVSNYRGEINSTNGLGYSFDYFENGEAFNLTGRTLTSDYYAYLGAIRQFNNPESIDINVFATPGIDLINNKLLCQDAIDMIEEERADSIYVATLPDKPYGADDYQDEMYTPSDIVDELSNTDIDSNYTCTYYPWIKYKDTDNNQYIFLPPTKDVVRNMALTDNTTQPWFAPAGLTRGSVDCTKAHYITKLADEDELYEGRINPIKTFAQDGVKIWGQKNLQVAEGQLNRIAVRRLLLRMRKLISIACLNLIFDPNDTTTKNKFLSLVTPIMDNIKSNRGLSDYRIEVNDTAESRQRRELPAKIYFKPYNALEYIDLEFIVTPESVSFDDI